MTQKFLVESLMISKKKIQPLFSIFACQKKKKIEIAIMCRMLENHKFRHLEGNTSPVNHLCNRVHMFF